MSEPKFTKGPWRVFIDDSGGRWSGWPILIGSVDDEDKSIVRQGGLWPYVWGAAMSQREAVANAHLIAASPDLYAAAERLAKGLDNLIGLGVIHKNYADEASDLSDAAHEALSKARGEPQ